MSDVPPDLGRAPAWARHLHDCMHKTQREVEALTRAVGQEVVGEDGKVSGTGLTGRIIRTEAKVLSYDRLKERAVGAFFATTALVAVIWWIVKAKVAEALGIVTGP